MLKLKKENLVFKIPGFLFAHNLEHTRACVYGGLSAQLIRNRKFAGKCGRDGLSFEWEKIGGARDYHYIDPIDTYTRHSEGIAGNHIEKNSQKFQNLSGGKCGIRQRGIALSEGADYELKIVAKADRGAMINVLIREPEKSRNLTKTAPDGIFFAAFSVAREYTVHEFNFASKKSGGDLILEIYTEEVSEAAIGAVSLLPRDNFHGMRLDVIENLKKIGTSMLRWPGGNFAGEYFWKDGLLNPDERAPLLSYTPLETQPYMFGFDNHEIGINQFVALCREINAEPSVTINLFHDSDADSRDFVEYCNGGPETVWGRKRVALGFAEPFNIKYWSLGNEMGYGHMEGLNTIESYTQKALSTAAEMKKADPEIIFCCSGPYPNGDWVSGSLKKLAGRGDYVSVHSYFPMNVQTKMKFTSEDKKRETVRLLTAAPYETMRVIAALRDSIDEECGKKDIKISFDEWNAWFAWYRTPNPAESLFAGVMMNNVIRMSDIFNMPVCCYFQPVNEGAILVDESGSRLTGIGMVFEMYKRHRGNKYIETGCFTAALNDEKPNEPGESHAKKIIRENEKNAVDILASYDENANEIIITCVNKSCGSYILEFETEGFGETEIKEVTELFAEDVSPGNETALIIKKTEPGAGTIIIDGYSILRATVKTGKVE